MASEENTPLLNGYEKKTQEKKGCCKTNIFGPEIVVVLFALYAAPVVITEEQFLYSLLQHEYTFINTSTDILFIRNDDAFSANEFEMDVQARASQIMLILTVTTSVLSMVSSLFYGSLSDTKGRKLILIVSLVGSVIKILTLLTVSVLKISYWVLLFGHVIDGVTGSYQTLLTGCFAYGADISKTEKRTLKVALLESCLGVAGAVGTISTGYITDRLGYSYTFSTLFGFGLLNLFYTICILPRATHKEGPIHIHHFYNYIYDGLKLYFKDNGTKRRWILQYNIVLALIILIVITAKTDSQTYFLKGKPLELDEIPVGYYSGWLILVQYLGCILAVVGLGPRLGDHWLIVIGCLCATMYFIYFAFVAQLWMLITGIDIAFNSETNFHR